VNRHLLLLLLLLLLRFQHQMPNQTKSNQSQQILL
jgi:hypothetical protein